MNAIEGAEYIPPEVWLEEKFECEVCEECGLDKEDHEARKVMGNWFALCNEDLAALVDKAAGLLGDDFEEARNPEYVRALSELLAELHPIKGVATGDRSVAIKRAVLYHVGVV